MFAEDLDHRETEVAHEAFELDAADQADGQDEAPRFERNRTEQVEVTYAFGRAVEDNFKRSLAKLTRTAKRYGQVIEVVERSVEMRFNHLTNQADLEFVTYKVSLPPIAGEGGKIVGRFEPTEDGKDFYVTVLDEDYRDQVDGLKARGGSCDHCGSKRDRKHTFVCLTEGEVKVVGKSCLKAVVGLDPAFVLNFWNALQEFTPEAIEGGWGQHFFDVQKGILAAYRVARKLGGYDRDRAFTHWSVLMWGPRGWNADEVRHQKEIEASYVGFDPEFDRAAFDEYVAGLDLRNDFQANFRRALNQPVLATKRSGLIVAGVGLCVGRVLTRAEKAKEEAERAAKLPPAKHLDAEVGKRLDFTAEVIRTYVYEGDFGPTCIISLVTDDGSRCVHFSTGSTKPEAGKRYAVRATVKKHGTNKRTGEPETVLSRATYKPETQGALL